MKKDTKTGARAGTTSFAETKDILVGFFSEPVVGGKKAVAMIYGGPGIGKNAVVELAAKEAGKETIIFNAAGHSREDIGGLGVGQRPQDPHGALGSTEIIGWSNFLPPREILELTKEFHEQQRKLHNAEIADLQRRLAIAVASYEPEEAEAIRGKIESLGEYPEPRAKVLFLDEFLNAPKEVQATYHALIDERKFGEGYTLLDNIDVVCAGNRKEDGASVHAMSTPMATRMTHITMAPTHAEFLNHARMAGFYPAMIAFIQSHEGSLNLSQEDVGNKDVLTTATQRGWEKVSVLCQISDRSDSADKESLKKYLAMLVPGTVGPKSAANFLAFLRTAREAPSADDIIANPDGIPNFKDKPDIAFTVVETMIARLRELSLKKDDKSVKKCVDAFLRYSKTMDKTYRAIFGPSMLNLQDGMSQSVILATLESEHAGHVYATADVFGRAGADGDAEARDPKAKLAEKKRKAAENAKKHTP